LVSSPSDLERDIVRALNELEKSTAAYQPIPEPHTSIPPDPVEPFVGREVELKKLARKLRNGGRVAVHGLGGIGKTQLAARYVQQYRDSYPNGTFWVRGETGDSLVADLSSLAWQLKLPESMQSQQKHQVAAVLAWLRQHSEWLLVVDDLDDEGERTFQRWLPYGLRGAVLVTSRAPRLSIRLSLEPWPAEVAVRFLLRRTGQHDEGAAGAIVEILGALPLALAQAAAYLEVSGRELASYGDLLHTRLLDLMQEAKPDGYPRPVATTWRLSFERLEGEHPPAAALLRLCAFLAPDNVPISILRAGAAELPKELREALADELAIDRAIAAARRYSLIERHGEGLRVHRLVQVIVRESLRPVEYERWLSATIRVLRAACPDEPTAFPERSLICNLLLSHVQRVDELAGQRTVEWKILSWLLDHIAAYLRARSEFAPAIKLQRRAVAIREGELGVDHLDAVEMYDNLAVLLWDTGDVRGAESLYMRTLTVREHMLGAEHPATARSLNSLGTLARTDGRLEAARILLERALEIRERVLDADHPDIAISLNNLAILHRESGDVHAARSLQERSLSIRERVWGADHPRTATSLNNLGRLLRDQGDFAAARPLLEKALAIFERVQGSEHPYTARCLHNLAILLWREGELLAAQSLAKRAYSIQDRTLGQTHGWTEQSKRTLAAISAELGGRAGTGPEVK
jgi:tetratricopeptide (TPR) repeat protein